MSAVTIKDVRGSLSRESAFTISPFDISAGEQLALLGKSGSGKSTLLNLLSGMLGVTEGSISINGHELVGKTEAQRDKIRREQIGMVFQTYQLLPEFSILENIQMGAFFSQQNNSNQAAELLDKAGLKGYENRFPHEISVGQQQRVAIVRALIKKPPVILADEPTGALDQETGSTLCALLQDLATDYGSSLIFVTHDQHLAKRFPKQVEVSDLLHWEPSERRSS